MKELYLYENISEGGASSACTYYRVDVLLEGLAQCSPIKIFRRHATDTPDYWLPAALASDIYHTYSTLGDGVLDQFRTIRRMRGGIQGDGQLKLPPVTVWDCDDNTDFVHPVNTTFAQLGVRSYPDLELLEPGDELRLEDAEGNLFAIWQDQVTRNGDGILFDIERNLGLMTQKHHIIKEAHGITVPSKSLASYMRNVLGHPHVYQFPNTVIPSHYREFPLVPRPEGEIRILWQGSMSHYVDWYPLRFAIKEISEKYPQVKWLIWGERFTWIHNFIPAHQVEYSGWVPYDAYKLQRGLMQADINVCPLADNLFNRGKSAIKWYEGSVWTKPEATLAANVGPYQDEMTDGENGLLYNSPEDFVQKLSALIESVELRRKLGDNAKKWVMSNRLPEHTIPGLLEFYEELQRIRIREVFERGSEPVKSLALQQGFSKE